MSSTTKLTPHIGYLGMGAMGSQMASRLLASGYPVSVWSRHAAHAAPLAAQGAQVAVDPRALAGAVDVLMSCVTDDTAVKALYLEETGVLAAVRPTTVVVDMSTILPTTSRALAEAGRQRGVAVLDAPVSGSVNHAGTGQLVIFVGGDTGAYECCRTIFSTLGRAHFHMGGNGAGSTTKLLVNAMLGTAIQVLGEALAFGQAGGLDREKILTALAETTVINPSQQAKFENIRHDRYPTTFALRLMAKDFALIAQLAAENRVPIPTIGAAGAVSAAALKTQDPNADYSSTIRFVEMLAGLRGPLAAKQDHQA